MYVLCSYIKYVYARQIEGASGLREGTVHRIIVYCIHQPSKDDFFVFVLNNTSKLSFLEVLYLLLL